MPSPYDIENIISTKPLRKHLEAGAGQLRDFLFPGSNEPDVEDEGDQMCGYEEVEEMEG